VVVVVCLLVSVGDGVVWMEGGELHPLFFFITHIKPPSGGCVNVIHIYLI
jgi:hypothetical protein